MSICVVNYLGVSRKLWVNQTKSFLSTQLTTIGNVLDCNIAPIAVEVH